MGIKIGNQYQFDYPTQLVTLDTYNQHRGEIVTVEDEIPRDYLEQEEDERMYLVRSEDGWIGCAYESELIPYVGIEEMK